MDPEQHVLWIQIQNYMSLLYISQTVCNKRICECIFEVSVFLDICLDFIEFNVSDSILVIAYFWSCFFNGGVSDSGGRRKIAWITVPAKHIKSPLPCLGQCPPYVVYAHCDRIYQGTLVGSCDELSSPMLNSAVNYHDVWVVHRVGRKFRNRQESQDETYPGISVGITNLSLIEVVWLESRRQGSLEAGQVVSKDHMVENHGFKFPRKQDHGFVRIKELSDIGSSQSQVFMYACFLFCATLYGISTL